MSDILIRGMEMPKEGEWISVNISPDGKCFIQSWCGKDFNFAEKLTAVPVPPHGRLIDADEFFNDICNSLNEMTAIGVAVDGEWMWGKLNDALRNAPTVLEAEEGE